MPELILQQVDLVFETDDSRGLSPQLVFLLLQKLLLLLHVNEDLKNILIVLDLRGPLVLLVDPNQTLQLVLDLLHNIDHTLHLLVQTQHTDAVTPVLFIEYGNDREELENCRNYGGNLLLVDACDVQVDFLVHQVFRKKFLNQPLVLEPVEVIAGGFEENWVYFLEERWNQISFRELLQGIEGLVGQLLHDAHTDLLNVFFHY